LAHLDYSQYTYITICVLLFRDDKTNVDLFEGVNGITLILDQFGACWRGRLHGEPSICIHRLWLLLGWWNLIII